MALETILLTGARAPITLELARSFALLGHRVIVADSLRLTVARWSSAVARYYTLPAPRTEADKFVEKLQYIIEKEGVTHLIPTCEEAFYVAIHQAQFDCKVWTAGIDLMHDLHNKYTFTQKFQQDLPTPATVRLTEFQDWENTPAYVFKPIYSRFATQILIGRQVLPTYFSADTRSAWIAQARIVGKEMCVYSVWEAGKLKGYASYHPLYRFGKGAAIFFEYMHDARVFELVAHFGQKYNYTGQLSFDVIIDEKEGPYFIECNPRGTSGAHLLGQDLGQAFLEEGLFLPQNNDSYTLKTVLGMSKPHLFFTEKVGKARDVVYHKSDKMPFFLQGLSVFEIAKIKFFKRLSWSNATMQDIIWDGF